MGTAPGHTLGTARRAARFASWVRAWRAGHVPYDDVVSDIEVGEDHSMVSADPPAGGHARFGGPVETPLREALADFSGLHPEEIRLVLPAPGDPRGLPGPGTAFTGEALAAGEGVIAGTTGLVPIVRHHTSGSGDQFVSVLWRAYALPDLPPGGGAPPSAAEAEAELTEALASATTALAALDVARWRPELANALAALRARDSGEELPWVFDPRARRLYSRASMVDRVLALADESAPGAAVNAFEAEQRDAALRPLATACRRALMAACNAPLP